MPEHTMAGPADIVAQLIDGGGGWDKIFDIKDKLGARIDRGDYDRVAECAREVFASPAGEKLLHWLIQEFLLSATWPGDVFGRDQMLTYGPFREGQNSMVVLLHKMLSRAHEIDLEEEPAHE
ncbi:hypothetical protein [Maricaulis sp.]|uniref:hypothetical protein n=1 Tax=Maricaulis sp. TaxID=1486257 RepID=UPI0032990550